MSRLFNDASSHHLEIDQAVLTAQPLALVGWFRSDDATIAQSILWLGDKDSATDYFSLYAGGQLAGDPVVANIRSSGSSEQAITSTGFSADTWHHAAALFATTTDRRALIDGGSKGTNTIFYAPPSALDRTSIGRFGDSSPGLYFSGRLAELAIYDLSVWPGADDTERADNFETQALPALAAGVLPIRIPLGLVGYWPLWGIHSTEIDLHPRSNDASDYSMTVTGATKANHAPVEPYSRRMWGSVPLVEAAAGGGGAFPFHRIFEAVGAA